MIHRGSRYPARLHRGDRKIHVLCKGGRPVWFSPEAQRAVLDLWIKSNVATKCVIVDDTGGRWFELEITLPGAFDGNPVDGWTGPIISGYPDIRVGIFWSANLTDWSDGGWVAAPGKTTTTLGDGRKTWFARYSAIPLIYKSALIDQRITTARYGKSITGLKLKGVAITSGMSYPYAMPSAAATLQTHLRAAGYTGATVTTTSGSWRAKIGDYNIDETGFVATWSGDNITEVRLSEDGSLVSLPRYPYTMPTHEAFLEADLLAAGYSYPQVTLFKDEWQIFLPDIATTGFERTFIATITPADPLQLWTFFGTSNGTNPQTALDGIPENIRISGRALMESMKAFARVGVCVPNP